MAAATTKPSLASEITDSFGSKARTLSLVAANQPSLDGSSPEGAPLDALQALLAFSVLHEQLRQRKGLGFLDAASHEKPILEFDQGEQFILGEVLQLVAERAVTIARADGVAIALAEDDEIVLRAAAGTVRPGRGARIDRDSAFSGACFCEGQIVNCDDTETDARVNLEACRRLGARSMVAVPLCGRRRVIGVLEAFSEWPFAFSDVDVSHLSLLAELVVGALRPEDEDRFAASAQIAATRLGGTSTTPRVEPMIETGASAAIAPDAAPSLEPAPAEAVPLEPSVEGGQERDSALDRLRELMGKAEVAKEPEPSFEETDPAGLESEENDSGISARGLRPLTLFVVLAVTVALAAGIWWKISRGGSRTLARREMPQRNPTSDRVEETVPIPSSTPGSLEHAAKVPANEQTSFPRITGIEHTSGPEVTTVIVKLEAQVQYEAHHLDNPDRFYFDLHGTRLAYGLTGQTIAVNDDLIKRVRVAQPVAGVTRVVLETAQGARLSSPQVSLESNPDRLIIEIRKPGTGNKGAGHVPPTDNLQRDKLAVLARQKPAGVQVEKQFPEVRIVLDAGHGGWDLGTVGRGGLVEKEVALDVTKRLELLLESRLCADVILTRKDDNYLSLEKRAAIANSAKADLLISVHANYGNLPSARGVETYFSESFPTGAPGEFAARSRRLAASVQRVLYSTLASKNPGLPNRGIKKADFTILTGSAMPAVLAEVSFVSSPADEKKLRTPDYREQIAEALFAGVAQYLADSRNVKLASTVN